LSGSFYADFTAQWQNVCYIEHVAKYEVIIWKSQESHRPPWPVMRQPAAVLPPPLPRRGRQCQPQRAGRDYNVGHQPDSGSTTGYGQRVIGMMKQTIDIYA
jgi:hypothetical protein